MQLPEPRLASAEEPALGWGSEPRLARCDTWIRSSLGPSTQIRQSDQVESLMNDCGFDSHLGYCRTEFIPFYSLLENGMNSVLLLVWKCYGSTPSW